MVEEAQKKKMRKKEARAIMVGLALQGSKGMLSEGRYKEIEGSGGKEQEGCHLRGFTERRGNNDIERESKERKSRSEDRTGGQNRRA